MPIRGPVLAATDLTDASDAALRQGHAIATDLGVPFLVCHVLPEVFKVRVLFPHEAGIDRETLSALEDRVRTLLAARLDAVLGSAPAAEVELESGTAHAGILEIAERVNAGLIVLGAGTTAHRVARSASGPVLIARAYPTGGGVLGATDLSDPSLPALKMAADEATRRAVRLRVLHCLEIDEAQYLVTAGLHGGMPMSPLSPAVTAQLAAAARERLGDALSHAGIASEAEVVVAPAASGIIDASLRIATSLIVVGTRGRTGLARLALGSVAEDVISRATCSVLVVRLSPS